MRSCKYWQTKGLALIKRQEKHLDEYHDSIFDIPVYIEIFFYCFMYLISPRYEDKTKYEQGDE